MLDGAFAVQTHGKITTRGGMYIQSYVRALGRATPVHFGSSSTFHILHMYYTTNYNKSTKNHTLVN